MTITPEMHALYSEEASLRRRLAEARQAKEAALGAEWRRKTRFLAQQTRTHGYIRAWDDALQMMADRGIVEPPWLQMWRPSDAIADVTLCISGVFDLTVRVKRSAVSVDAWEQVKLAYTGGTATVSPSQMEALLRGAGVPRSRSETPGSLSARQRYDAGSDPISGVQIVTSVIDDDYELDRLEVAD